MAITRDALYSWTALFAVWALLLTGVCGGEATAQVPERSPESAPTMDRPRPSQPDASRQLPSWAEPSSIPTRETPNIDENRSDVISNSNPGNPGVPDPVPIDGLSLLALAGAGYAARKLRQSSGEDEDRDDAA
jgi:hypothetical protein